MTDPQLLLLTLLGSLSIVLFLISCVTAFITVRMRGALRADTARLQQQLEALGIGHAQLASTTDALRSELVGFFSATRADRQFAVAQGPGQSRAYDLAARLAAGGSNSAELVRSCGLSQAEAELTVLVHGRRVQGL
jgi:hypothetical protein